MVAFPDSKIEPKTETSIDDTGLDMSKDSNKNSNGGLANDRRVRDEAFATPRVKMPSGKDSYALKFDSIDKLNDKKLSVEINPEPVFMKKVAGKSIKSRD